MADQCRLKPATGIAYEFGAWRRSPPHYYSIAAPAVASSLARSRLKRNDCRPAAISCSHP
jgi:hypothetical protein